MIGYDRTGAVRIPVREANVVTNGNRRTVGTITRLLGMVVALALVLAAACGEYGQVDESHAGIENGRIAKSEL